jgi:ferredoxin
MRVIVDSARCVGHARCLALAPDLFEWDEETDRARTREGADLADFGDLGQSAIDGCPEGAISLA